MGVDIYRWPPQAWLFQEVIAAAVESFSNEGRRFDHAKSGSEQLRDRILELRMPKQRQLEALNMVQNNLTERECVDICLSLRP